jgi:dipeptidyl aminopeptidase/acylaminoacyl peptidase
MDADGSGQTNITNNSANDGGPSWSPDGTRIAFSSGRDDSDEVYVMDADGTGQTRVTTTTAGHSYFSSWQSAPVVPPTTTTTTVAPPTTAPPAVVVAVTATPTFTG